MCITWTCRINNISTPYLPSYPYCAFHFVFSSVLPVYSYLHVLFLFCLDLPLIKSTMLSPFYLFLSSLAFRDSCIIGTMTWANRRDRNTCQCHCQSRVRMLSEYLSESTFVLISSLGAMARQPPAQDLIKAMLIRVIYFEHLVGTHNADISLTNQDTSVTDFKISGTITPASPSKNQSPSIRPFLPPGVSARSMLITATLAPFARALST